LFLTFKVCLQLLVCVDSGLSLLSFLITLSVQAAKLKKQSVAGLTLGALFTTER